MRVFLSPARQVQSARARRVVSLAALEIVSPTSLSRSRSRSTAAKRTRAHQRSLRLTGNVRGRRYGERDDHRAVRLIAVRATSRTIAVLALVSLTVALAACGGSSKSRSDGSGSGAKNSPLPAECTLPPFTAHVQRDGGVAAGSDTYEVIGAAAIQIPLVPDQAQTLSPAQAIQMGKDTDLLGYGLLFGDEQFGIDDVSLFDGYAPTAEGKSRGVITIYPSTLIPLAVGDVITPTPMDALAMFTTLNNVGMDFKAAPDEFMSYLNAIRGSVTILGLTDQAICLDVDLSWDTSDFSTSATGTLTIQGIFTAPLGERTLPFG